MAHRMRFHALQTLPSSPVFHAEIRDIFILIVAANQREIWSRHVYLRNHKENGQNLIKVSLSAIFSGVSLWLLPYDLALLGWWWHNSTSCMLWHHICYERRKEPQKRLDHMGEVRDWPPTKCYFYSTISPIGNGAKPSIFAYHICENVKNRRAQGGVNLIAPFMQELIQDTPARGCPQTP